jgi:hypothetical protein
MATEWGITTFLTTKDLKVRIPFRNTDGDLYTLATMPDFTLKFWIENRESTKLTATKVGEMLTNCYIDEEDGYLYVNIPKNTFSAGRLCVAFEPIITDETFDDGTFEPSAGKILDNIRYI